MPAIDEESNTVNVINISPEIAKFELAGTRYRLSPGEVLPVHKAYGLPRELKKGSDPLPAVVELLTGKRVVHTGDPRAKAAMTARAAASK